jgi:hypothetical protein
MSAAGKNRSGASSPTHDGANRIRGTQRIRARTEYPIHQQVTPWHDRRPDGGAASTTEESLQIGSVTEWGGDRTRQTRFGQHQTESWRRKSLSGRNWQLEREPQAAERTGNRAPIQGNLHEKNQRWRTYQSLSGMNHEKNPCWRQKFGRGKSFARQI